MSKCLSFRDLLIAEELSHLNEIELLFPENDEVVKAVLLQCGFDINKPIEYVPSQHRDMQGKVAVSFMAVGEVHLGEQYRHSPVMDITDRLIATAYQDTSLTRELAGMMGNHVNYKSLLDAEDSFDEINTEDEVEETCEWVTQQIKQLQVIHDMIRGKKQ